MKGVEGVGCRAWDIGCRVQGVTPWRIPMALGFDSDASCPGSDQHPQKYGRGRLKTHAFRL